MNEMKTQTQAEIIEQVVISGDLAKLTPEQRVGYYKQVCNSLQLNPLTRPFDYIVLNGKLTLYARKDATDQLRPKHKLSIIITDRAVINDVYVVTARATTQDGRTDESTGAVYVGGLKGDALANAMMKAETKSKRRVTLSIVGLGILDETEVETIPDARPERTAATVTGDTAGTPPTQAAIDAELSHMPLEQAVQEVNSDGQSYNELPTDTLSHMERTLHKKIQAGAYQEPELSDKMRKLAACKAILHSREVKA